MKKAAIKIRFKRNTWLTTIKKWQLGYVASRCLSCWLLSADRMEPDNQQGARLRTSLLMLEMKSRLGPQLEHAQPQHFQASFWVSAWALSFTGTSLRNPLLKCTWNKKNAWMKRMFHLERYKRNAEVSRKKLNLLLPAASATYDFSNSSLFSTVLLRMKTREQTIFGVKNKQWSKY